MAIFLELCFSKIGMTEILGMRLYENEHRLALLSAFDIIDGKRNKTNESTNEQVLAHDSTCDSFDNESVVHGNDRTDIFIMEVF